MPSSEYHRRQADTLVALALNTSDPELSTLCLDLAIEYKLLAEQAVAAPAPTRSGTLIVLAGEQRPTEGTH
jgi:hypothetical protein